MSQCLSTGGQEHVAAIGMEGGERVGGTRTRRSLQPFKPGCSVYKLLPFRTCRPGGARPNGGRAP